LPWDHDLASCSMYFVALYGWLTSKTDVTSTVAAMWLLISTRALISELLRYARGSDGRGRNRYIGRYRVQQVAA